MPIEFNNKHHLADFVRLNEQWISQYFAIEEADRQLFAHPYRIVENGGHILTLVEGGCVVGGCALVKEEAARYQLARMAVDPAERGKGHGGKLLRAAIERARQVGAGSIYLLSNTKLAPAIALYRKHGFSTVMEGPHPAYERCNIVMELAL